MLSNKKPCTKVLEIQKLVGFDCVFLNPIKTGGGELLSRSKNEAYLTWPKDTLKVGK